MSEEDLGTNCLRKLRADCVGEKYGLLDYYFPFRVLMSLEEVFSGQHTRDMGRSPFSSVDWITHTTAHTLTKL